MYAFGEGSRFYALKLAPFYSEWSLTGGRRDDKWRWCVQISTKGFVLATGGEDTIKKVGKSRITGDTVSRTADDEKPFSHWRETLSLER